MDRDEIKEIIAVMLFLGTVVGFVVTLGIFAEFLITKKRCAEYSTALTITTHHDFWTGCIVEFHDGKKISLDKYLIVDTPSLKIP